MERAFERYKSSQRRLTTFYFVYAAVFLWLLGSLAWRQLICANTYVAQSQRQSLRRIVRPGIRGKILDRNGVVLADNKPMYSAVLYLGELRDELRATYREIRASCRDLGIKGLNVGIEARQRVVQRYYAQLNAILGTQHAPDLKAIEKYFSQHLLLPMPMVKNLTPQQYALLLEKLPIDSPLQVQIDATRYYPHGSLAAHLIGYVAFTDELPYDAETENLPTLCVKTQIGKSGVEKFYDDRLQGASGYEVWLVDPGGFRYHQLDGRNATQGIDLQLSLDVNVQKSAETAFGQKTGAVVVMDVHTGETLAMLSKPDYDLNSLCPYIPADVYKNIEERKAWINRCIQGLYPPGSAFKILSVSVLLREHTITTTTQCTCIGYSTIGGRKFHCSRRLGHGTLDTMGAVTCSCNPFFFDNALKCGPLPFMREAQRFGLHTQTGVDLPFETRGMCVPTTPTWKIDNGWSKWTDGDTANLVIGQGFLLNTPLQAACLTASFARNETRTRPTVLKSNIAVAPSVMCLDAATHSFVVQCLAKVGEKANTGNIRVAGKTGTAQFMVKGALGDVVWFVGFAPVENPKYAVAVLVEETTPEEHYWASTTATPIAKKIFETLFKMP